MLVRLLALTCLGRAAIGPPPPEELTIVVESETVKALDGGTVVGSVHAAQAIARRLPRGRVRIELLPGVHRLTEPLVLNGSDSGTLWAAADAEQKPRLSGGCVVQGFAPCGDRPGLWCAAAPAGAQPRHLYLDDRRLERPRAPSDLVAKFAALAMDSFSYTVADDLDGWGAGVEFVYTGEGAAWTESRCCVERVDRFPNGTSRVVMKQPCFSILQDKPCHQSTRTPAHVENSAVRDLAPGEWMLHGETVVYRPAVGEALEKTAAFVMPVLEVLLEVSGAKDVTFSDVVFEHSTWARPNEGLGFVEQQSGALVDAPANGTCDDATWRPMPASCRVVRSERIVFTGCAFEHLGATALSFSGGAQSNTVRTCEFQDVSGAAVQLGSYDTSRAAPADQERNNTLESNRVARVGVEFHGSNAIAVGYSKKTRVVHNDIRNLTYTGISVGWGWAREPLSYAGDNFVGYNRIDAFKLQTARAKLGDGGGIYALGPQPGSEMRGNWLSNMGAGRGGGAVYPDEGSAFWTIADTVFSGASFCQDDCEWLHIWIPSIHDIHVTNAYTDTHTFRNDGTNCTVEGVHVVDPAGPWPQLALDIMRNAGIREPTQESLNTSRLDVGARREDTPPALEMGRPGPLAAPRTAAPP